MGCDWEKQEKKGLRWGKCGKTRVRIGETELEWRKMGLGLGKMGDKGDRRGKIWGKTGQNGGNFGKWGKCDGIRKMA